MCNLDVRQLANSVAAVELDLVTTSLLLAFKPLLSLHFADFIHLCTMTRHLSVGHETNASLVLRCFNRGVSEQLRGEEL